MNRTLEHILPRVQKPARYTGGEYNAVVKDRRAVDVRLRANERDGWGVV